MSCWLSYVFDDSLMCFRLQNRLFVLFCARASSLFIHEGCICFSWPLCWYDCAEISKLFLELVRPNEFLSHGLLNISRVKKIIFKMRFFLQRTHTSLRSKRPLIPPNLLRSQNTAVTGLAVVCMNGSEAMTEVCSQKHLSLSTTTPADLQPHGSPSASVTSASLAQRPVKIQMRADFQLGFLLRKLICKQPQIDNHFWDLKTKL